MALEKKKKDQRTLDWNDINATEPATSFGVPVENNSFGQNEPVKSIGQTDAGLLSAKPKVEEPEIPNAYDELFKTYEGRLKKEEEYGKARRGRAAINGIADMGRAIANLVATSQYAPNGYDPAQSLSASAQTRYEKAKAERDKHRTEWLNYALKKKALMDDVRDRKYKEKQLQNQQEYNTSRLQQQQEYNNSRLAQIQQEIDRKKAEDEARNEAARIKANNDGRTAQWKTAVANKSFNYETEKANLENEKNSGSITLEEYNSALIALDKVEAYRATLTERRTYQAAQKNSKNNRGGRGGRGRNRGENNSTTNNVKGIVTDLTGWWK